ncbi:23992_t:CDS:2, partial [Racocetra persica]
TDVVHPNELYTYFSKIISVFIFIVCLIISVESHFNCPLTANSHEALQTFIIQLSSTASRDTINNHYAMLASCFNKIISDDSTIKLDHHSIIKDVSFGSFICYIGKFGPSDATGLASLPENLDRIDQKRRPLNGKYTYPSSAGSNVNVYIVDTGVNVNHLEFGGRAKLGPVLCEGCPNIDDFG